MPARTTELRSAPGRWRRRIGAASVTLGLLWSAPMIASIWYWYGYCGAGWLADIGDGTLYVGRWTGAPWRAPLEGWHGGRNEHHDGKAVVPWSWTWWTWGMQVNMWDTTRGYTIWPPAPALLILGGAAYLSGRRAARCARGLSCLHCGYSLAGLTAGANCPECGR